MSRAEGGIAPLLRDYRDYAGARLWLALALMLLGAIAEGFGILMLIPLAAIATGTSSRFSFVLGWLPEKDRFVAALLLFVGFMGARSLLLYWRERELARLQCGYEASLRVRAAATLSERGWAFASTVGQAGMQALLLTDVPRSALAVAQAQQFATALVLLCVQLLIATILSPALGVIALLAVAGGFVVSMRWTRRSVATGLALTARSEASTGSGFRLHAGLKTALAQGTVGPFLSEYASTLRQQQDEAVRFAGDLTSARQLAAFGAAAAAAFVIFIGFSVLHLAFAVLVPVLVLFARMVGPAQVLQHAAQTVGAYSSAFTAICRTLGGLHAGPSREVRQYPIDWNELRLEQVTFRHPSERGIEHMDLVLRRGQWLGLRGPSGTGKTTLVDLVSGLLHPQSGRVLVDGASVEGETRDGWRAGIAYVGQEGLVFDDSIRGNLLADGADADEERLWEALGSVGLADRVRAFPAKLDEQVGDRGSRLSGGERQRLVIARAILRRPSLLILDEATAALDAESEAALLDRLRAIEPRPAAMIIAHRESTLAHCDSVLSIRHT